jgi:hypothetical protein
MSPTNDTPGVGGGRKPRRVVVAVVIAALLCCACIAAFTLRAIASNCSGGSTGSAATEDLYDIDRKPTAPKKAPGESEEDESPTEQSDTPCWFFWK